MKLLKRLFPLLFVLSLSLITIIPFFHSGFFSFHDNTQVQRVFEMSKALRDGVFPVRWSQDLGFNYGYPMFNFYAPFAYYLGAFFNLLGANVLLATKIMMVLGVMLASFSIYLFTKELFNKKTAVVAALLYVFAPFHAVDTYVRGDVAELWAFVFIPLIFYALYKIYKTPNFSAVALGAFSYAGLILSHNLSAFMATPFILLFLILLILLKKDKKTAVYLGLPVLLGILISAFYWFPAVLEMGYTNVASQTTGGANFRDHFVCITQLWASPWGFGGSVKGCVDGLSFMIGKSHLALALLSAILFVLIVALKKMSKDKILIFGFLIFGFLVSVFLTLDYSKFIWEAIKPMAFLQYPWRFLLLISFFISILAAGMLYFLEVLFKNVKNKWFIALSLVTALVIVLLNVKFFVPQTYSLVDASYFTNAYFLKWKTSTVTGEYMPKDFLKPSSFAKLPNRPQVIRGKIQMKMTTHRTGFYAMEYDSDSVSEVLFPIAYFPAWRSKIDNQNSNYQVKNNGLLITLPSGNHVVTFYYEQTPIEKAADIISICGILILVLAIIYRKPYEKSS